MEGMDLMFVVYSQIDPRTELPFYIGKGDINRAFLFKRDNLLYQNVLHKIRSSGLEPRVEILHQCETEKEAFVKEKLEIDFYGRRDIGTGCLTNMTDGGEGSCGSRHSEEFKAELSIRMAGNKFGRGNKKGIKFSDETKAKMRASRIAAVRRESEFYLNRRTS